MPPAEHVKRKVAVAVVVAVKEAAFLIPVQRIVGRVEIEHDLARRFLMRVEKQVDEQPLDRRRVMADLVIARRLARPRRMLQTVQRALARQRRRLIGRGIELAEQHAQNRIAAKLIVVVEVLKTRCATRALSAWTVKRRLRRSAKQAANRSVTLIALSASSSSNAPASDETIPPSKSATTRRPPALPKSISVRLHCVGIGELLRISLTR